MLDELLIDTGVEIENNLYFVLSFGMTHTRLFCDLITEDIYKHNEMQKTYKESILKFIKDINFGIEFCDLYVNGYFCSTKNVIFRHINKSDVKKNKMLNTVDIPQELKRKSLTLIRMNFDLPPCINSLEDIEVIKFEKRGTKSTLLIGKDMNMSLGILEEPYAIEYKDNQLLERTLYVDELSVEDEKLFIYVEVEKDIFDFQVFIKEELEQSRSNKMRGIIPAQKIENKNSREGYHMLKQSLGNWKNNENVNVHFLLTRAFKEDKKEYIFYKR